MRQYDYDATKDWVVLDALIKVWNPPVWAAPMTTTVDGQPIGNCIRAARFAQGVLAALHVQCEVAAMRVYGPGSFTGWGDCRSYADPGPRGFSGHLVVIGHGWLLDVAAQAAGISTAGQVIAKPTTHGVWTSEEVHAEYTWAPGLINDVYRDPEWGSKAATTRMARDVRAIVGPRRRPRAYEV